MIQKKLMNSMDSILEGYEGQMIRQDAPMSVKGLKHFLREKSLLLKNMM